MANWLDTLTENLKITADPIGLSRRVPALPEYYSPADAGAHYLTKGVLGAADLAKLPIAAAAQVPDASSALFDWATTKKNAAGVPLNPFDRSAQTAEQAIRPDPAQVEQKAAELAKQEKVKKANEQAAVEQALLNSDTVRLGGGGGSSKEAAMPDIATMTQAEPAKEPEQDFSKAMLRAGIAMMQSKGDIWDAIGAGFGGYQASLDQQEADKAKAEKEARELALEQYKMDLYGKQVMFPYWNAQRGGGTDWKEQNAARRLDLQEQKQQKKDDLDALKTMLDIQDKIDTAPDATTKAKYLQYQYQLMGQVPGANNVASSIAGGFNPGGNATPKLPLK